MTPASIVDVDAVVTDLRLVTGYASRVGLLRDKTVLDTLKAAEKTLRSDAEPDVHALTSALNDVVQLISPMTLADLHFGRDPFSAVNQKRARVLQLWLTFFALVALLLIGYFMQSLHTEQDAIHTLQQLQELRPQQKLTALRKIAQFEKPLDRPNTSHDTYHQKFGELMQINSKLMVSYNNAVGAATIPLFPPVPLAKYMSPFFSGADQAAPLVSGSAGGPAPPPSAGQGVAASGIPASAPVTPSGEVLPTVQASEICVAEPGGAMSLPSESLKYPVWIRTVLSDALSDYCFQVKVLSPAGQGALLNESLGQLAFVPLIKEKVSLRVHWFLPFFYGVLGSIIFVMRNIASVRTPSMAWFPILMRISLGGVAGIVIGWFSASVGPAVEANKLLSVPFALAFLTGYGIDVLFSVLDRLNRAIGETSVRKAA